MADVPEEREEHITIAVEADRITRQTLELAVELAAAVKGHLRGLFIENAELLNTARLPFTCEITYSAGLQRNFDVEGLESRYRQLAQGFQHSLAEAAGKSVVRYSFQSIRGLSREVMKAHAGGYLILEGAGGRRQWQQRAARIRILVVAETDSERLRRVLQLLCRKLAMQPIDIFWLDRRDDASARVSLPANASVHRLDKDQLEAVLHSPLNFLVMNQSDDSALLSHIVADATCPVIVVA